MPRANPAEVWIANLGLAAKVRPCLVLSDYPAEDELSLLILVPHTTAVRNNRWELSIPKPFLKPRTLCVLGQTTRSVKTLAFPRGEPVKES